MGKRYNKRKVVKSVCITFDKIDRSEKGKERGTYETKRDSTLASSKYRVDGV